MNAMSKPNLLETNCWHSWNNLATTSECLFVAAHVLICVLNGVKPLTIDDLKTLFHNNE